MKTITLNSDNRSILLAEDADSVLLESNYVQRGSERIYGLPSSTVTLHESVTVPDDWEPSRYLFDGTTWSANPDWVDLEDEYTE